MRAFGLCALAALTALASYGCAEGTARAQSRDEHYAGRRVYIQSLVYDLRDHYQTALNGGGSVTIRAKAAADLTSVAPRVNDSLFGVSSVAANETRSQVAASKANSGAEQIRKDINAGDEIAWDQLWLGGNSNNRSFCSIDLGARGAHAFTLLFDGSFGDASQYRYRVSSRNCRVRPPLTLTGGQLDLTEVQANADFARPSISLGWIDRRRNKGDHVISGFNVIFPAPLVDRAQGISVDTDISSDEGQRLLDPRAACDISNIRVLSIGIQNEKPTDEDALKGLAGLDDGVDYFDGAEGRQVAGHVMSCELVPSYNVEVVLPPMDVYISEEDFRAYNSKITAVVKTKSVDKIEHSAELHVFKGTGGDAIVKIPFVKDPAADGYIGVNFRGLSGTFPSARFVVAASQLEYEDKPVGRSDAPDVAKIKLEVHYKHSYTVERPPLIKTKKVSATERCFYRSCISTSRGSCGCTGDEDSCRRSGNKSCGVDRTRWERAPEISRSEYYEAHERVDNDGIDFRPGSQAEITYGFKRKVFFEDIFVTFDKPYQELAYVDPTPVSEFGDREIDHYVELGETVGVRMGEVVKCASDIESPWTYVDGKGCRPEVACCISAPIGENACGDVISDEEFNCPLAAPACRFFSDESDGAPSGFPDDCDDGSGGDGNNGDGA